MAGWGTIDGGLRALRHVGDRGCEPLLPLRRAPLRAPLPKVEFAGRHTRVFLSWRGGLLQVAERFLAQYYPDFGGCPDSARLGGALYSVDVATLIDGGVVITGEPYSGRPAVVIVAVPRTAP